MLFKNLIIYRFTKPFSLTPESLESQLEKAVFTPCGSQDVMKQGWVEPLGRHGQQRVHTTNGQMMICLKREEKLLPASVIKELMDEKIAQIEDEQGRKIGKKERNELKDDITNELLPKAFCRANKTFAYIAPKEGLLVVNASSAKKAEEFSSFLRTTIGSLPVRPPVVKEAPAAIMTHWLNIDSPLPPGIELGTDCVLQDTGEDAATVRCKGMELTGEEISKHLECGKQAVKVALNWQENLSFMLSEDLAVKGLKFGDQLQEQIDDSSEDAASHFDASFAIMSLELSRLIPAIFDSFGGEDLSAVISTTTNSASMTTENIKTTTESLA